VDEQLDQEPCIHRPGSLSVKMNENRFESVNMNGVGLTVNISLR
jgi:hypothetical protein